jgi:uncharacterized protein (TIGR00290 family)
MGEALSLYRGKEVGTVAFGDLFLADIRSYRDGLAARNGMNTLYPVWGRDTAMFIREFLQLGFQAVTTCVDLNVLDESFAGRLIDEDFLADLPEGVDPCGENGEFHTFVFAGPLFREPIDFVVGERLQRGPFVFVI